MTIDCQMFEKCICQTTSAIDEGVLKNVSEESMERKGKSTAVDYQRVFCSIICALSLSLCSSDCIPLFLSVFLLSPSAYVLTTAGALQ